MGGKEQIKGLALCIHRAGPLSPFPFNFHVRLVKMPAAPHRALLAAKRFLNLWSILDDPAIEGGMIDGHTPLAPHLFPWAVTERIGHIPSHAPQNNCPLELTPLEVDPAASPPPHD